MNDTEKANYLRSLPLDELLRLAHAQKRSVREDGPAWKRLDRFHCHVCHKPIKDEESVRLGIGGSDCRPRVEREEGKGKEMWENITQAELERIWTKYNLYGVVFLGRTYEVKDVHMKHNSQREAMMFVVLHDCDQVMVSKKGAVSFCGLNDARSMYKAWM